MTGGKSILIIGGSGFLGTHIALKLRENHRVVVTFQQNHVPLPGVLSIPMEIKDEGWMKRVVYTQKPEVIIYIAGYRDTGWMEGNPTQAERLVSSGPGEVLKVADIFQPRMIYLSSCYVFDGSRGNYKETDNISPYNTMGKLKAGGENLIRSRSSIYTIIRSSPLFGISHPWRPTFFDQLRLALAREERVELQNYELHSFAPVQGMVDLVENVVNAAPKKSIYHYGGLNRVSHYEFGRLFAKEFGFKESLLVPIRKSKTKGQMASDEHPVDFSLNSSEVIRQYKTPSYDIAGGLGLYRS